jgi:predicted dehydrogenase
MLRVGIVGCGKIADSHAMQIQRIRGCEIFAVCDREPLMAKQLYERFPVKSYFTDLEEMLDKARPDVIHVTTPAETHFAVASNCLERGCHVYVEKPFTLYADEARQLIELAQKRNLKITVGHNEQFSHVAQRMRALVKTGYLGGPIVHMESFFVYDLGDPSYARALLGDKQHWVRRLPGKLLQNVISHGIARIAEFLTSESPEVVARGFVSPFLKGSHETEIIDELRVILCGDDRTTAYFTFSSQSRPSIHEFRIFGPKNGLILDQDHEILLQLRGRKFKSYADKFVPQMLFARQHLANLFRNAGLFLRRDFHMDSGMKYLIEAFYRSIVRNEPVPIPYREILLTARIMDSIFAQVGLEEPRKSSLQTRAAPVGPVALSTKLR